MQQGKLLSIVLRTRYKETVCVEKSQQQQTSYVSDDSYHHA
jgi:hypothetical protein